MRPFALACFFIASLVGALPAAVPNRAQVVIPNAAQPQLAVTAEGRVYVAYGRGNEVLVARSDDGGATFTPATTVASVPKLMLGLRRGPRISAQGDQVTVTLIAHELLAFHSADGGRSWSGATTVNEVPASAREGLHDLAAGPEGIVFVTWLDLRNGAMELWGAQSDDAGRTWGRNAPVYRSPEKSICECCHPTARFDSAGNLAVMWRNSIGGDRDMWIAIRARGAAAFSAAHKLGTGTWTLKACPMDGGGIVPLDRGQFATVWQRSGDIFFCPAKGPEISLGPGKQPVGIIHQGQPVIFWQQGPDLLSTRPIGKAETTKHAVNARFATLASLPHGRGTVLAYEQGPAKESSVVIERL